MKGEQSGPMQQYMVTLLIGLAYTLCGDNDFSMNPIDHFYEHKGKFSFCGNTHTLLTHLVRLWQLLADPSYAIFTSQYLSLFTHTHTHTHTHTYTHTHTHTHTH